MSADKVFLRSDVGEESFADGDCGGATGHGEGEGYQCGCPRLVGEEVVVAEKVYDM